MEVSVRNRRGPALASSPRALFAPADVAALSGRVYYRLARESSLVRPHEYRLAPGGYFDGLTGRDSPEELRVAGEPEVRGLRLLSRTRAKRSLGGRVEWSS